MYYRPADVEKLLIKSEYKKHGNKYNNKRRHQNKEALHAVRINERTDKGH